MLGTAIIVFREVLEAALIVGLVLAATRGIAGRERWATIGIIGGLLGAIALALAANAVNLLADGMGQEVMNASILFAAVLMLSWHLLWMRNHSLEIGRKIRDVGAAVNSGDKEPVIIALIIGLAILREGSETVLFLYGIGLAGSNAGEMLIGSVLGIVSGIVAGSVLYLGIARIPTGRLFQVSGWLILLLTAGLASQAISYLVQADLVPALGYSIWDSSFLLSEHSIVGHVMHILVGYVDQPMGVQVLVYLLTIVILSATMLAMNRDSTTAGAIQSAEA